jgi:N-acetylglucosaminyldiphosphoundecaprenol N-acetyl-beta-D-mannosaminyltransferase
MSGSIKSSPTKPLHPGDVRVDVLGVEISAVDPADAAELIGEWIVVGQPHYVCVTGVHGVMESQRDEELRKIHNASGMTVPDGMPLVWLGHRAGAAWMQRVYGPDLMLAICGGGVDKGLRHFFYGGGDGVATLLSDRLMRKFPGLKVAGMHTPPFRDLTTSESADVVDQIEQSDADVVWVGLSTPKQERFMAAHVDRLSKAQLLGVGAAFDMHAGLLRQAPSPVQKVGMEWAFRLALEPRRLWKRYAKNNPTFVRLALRHPPFLLESIANGRASK